MQKDKAQQSGKDNLRIVEHRYLLCRCLGCLLYTSDAADELDGVDLGGRRIIKKKFFQAEDGIRDQPRSRGLGDVYKRQALEPDELYGEILTGETEDGEEAVSYTHLTLPTN